jgi:PAS domain S-box-containing protein
MQLPDSLRLPAGHDSPFFGETGATTALFSHDLSGMIQFVSQSAMEVLGYPRESLIGTDFESFLTEHPWNTYMLNVAGKTIAAGEIQVVNCEFLGGDGKRIPLEICRYMVVFGERPVGFVCLARQIPSASDLLKTASHFANPSDVGQSLLSRWESLSNGELEVIELIVQGQKNKTIAKSLQVTERAIEAQRSKAMRKLAVRSVSDLVKLKLLVEQHRKNQSTLGTGEPLKWNVPNEPPIQRVAENHMDPEP